MTAFWTTAWKVRVRSFSGPYFHEFGLNADQKNSQYGHFSRNEYVSLYCLLSFCQSCPCTCKSHFQCEERENIVKAKSCYLVKYSDTFKDGIPQKLSLNKPCTFNTRISKATNKFYKVRANMKFKSKDKSWKLERFSFVFFIISWMHFHKSKENEEWNKLI